MAFKLFDVVETTSALPDHGLVSGSVGAIVDVYSDGTYEVEFANEVGETIALVPLSANQIVSAIASK